MRLINYRCWVSDAFFIGESEMKRILLSVLIMILLPFLAVTFVKGDNGMAVVFILFYMINPLFSIYVGYIADKWIYPFINSLLFLLGTWIFFDIGEIAFVYYAIVYLLLGLITMLIKQKCKI